jgi:hypothetical protein
MSAPHKPTESWELTLGESLKDAHELLGTVSLRQVARDLELSHAALIRVRQGDMGAVGRDTLLRILDYYGLKAPSELILGAKAPADESTRRIAAFCSSPQCPMARVYFVNERWTVRPLTLDVPASLFEGGREPVCRECGSPLSHRCPECGQAFVKGAFCPWCSAGYVSTHDLREEEFKTLRAKWAALVEFGGQIETY